MLSKAKRLIKKEKTEAIVDIPVNNTSRGWVFDLVNSIANDLALTNHLHEAFYAAYKDAEDGIEGASDKIINYRKLMDMTLTNRRNKMNILKGQADSYDKHMWCPLKHAIESYMESMEVWQAHESKETFDAMITSTDILSGVLSLFLGMELEICGRCLSDQLKEG